jgi:glutathione S-transferase
MPVLGSEPVATPDQVRGGLSPGPYLRGPASVAELVLFNAPQSTCSQRVRFVLLAKGLAFEERRLDLFAGDQLKPDYLAINPNGVVPSLVHRDRVVIDSSVIMEYLDEVFRAPESLVPEDAIDRAKMRALMRFIDEVPAAAIRVPSYNLAFLPTFQAMSEEEFRALAESKPLRKEFLLKMGRTGFSDAEMKSSMEQLARSIRRMDDMIRTSGGPFMLGQLTLADIAIMPVIVRLDDINLASMWDQHPSVATWLDAIRGHHAYAKAYYPGSLLTEKYPHLRKQLSAAG